MSSNPMADRLAAVRQVKQSSAPPPQPPAHPVARTAPSRRRPVGERWEDRVARATFHIDRDLLDELPAAADRAGMSKSEFVREALRRAIQDANRTP